MLKQMPQPATDTHTDRGLDSIRTPSSYPNI